MAGILPSGHTYTEINEEETERLGKKFSYLSEGGIKIQPQNSLYAKPFLKFAHLIYNFEARESDIFINTVAKSGTNWLGEIVWNLVHNPDLDNPDSSLSLDYRYPFFDVDFVFAVSSSPKFDPEGELVKRFMRLCPGRDPNDGLHIYTAAALPDPRLLKGHTPLSFWNPNLFDKAKVIYLARDPRDVLVSAFHFYQYVKVANYSDTLEVFVEDFIKGNGVEPFWPHVKLAWEKRNHQNFLFLFYEDLKENPKEQIKKVDQFIGTNRTDKQIDNIVHCTTFDFMKEKSKENSPLSFDNTLGDQEKLDEGANFFRKGKVGSWREELPLHLQEKLNSWMKINLKQFSEDFKYKEEQYSS